MEDRSWARDEAASCMGTCQVLKLGIWGDFWWEVLDGHTGVKTVGVDLIQMSQTGWTAQRLSVKHSRNKAQETRFQ